MILILSGFEALLFGPPLPTLVELPAKEQAMMLKTAL